MDDFNDSDIKIANGITEKHVDEEIDAIAVIEEAKRQHFNGNSAKAKQIGRNIVSAFSYKCAPEELLSLFKKYGIAPTDRIMMQAKILSVFAAEYSLEHFMPSQYLSVMAVDAMYDIMRETESKFFDELVRSSAFSFYYLCEEENGDISVNVGRQFAFLCGDRDSDTLSELGKELFDINSFIFKRAVNSYVFV